MEKKTLIRVGHNAYKGVNGLRMCFSKAQAIRVLRNRGVKRDDARTAVNATIKDGGYSVRPVDSMFDSIELCNYSGLSIDYAYTKMTWANAPEL